ncbi:cytoplasmic dynein 1 heavy chain 1-like isoform X1 [Styela clava]
MAENSGGGETQEIAESSALIDYICKLVPLLLEDGSTVPSTLKAVLEDRIILESIRKFLSDPQVRSLMVERISHKDESEEAEEQEPSYNISVDVHYSNGKASGLALIKRGVVVEADKPISQQIRAITLTEDSPYETLHSLVSCAVAPFFKSYIRESGKIDREGDKMAPSVEKKIAELEMGLLHLQQNIDIPEISLPIHPTVTGVIRKCQAESRRARVQDFGDKVEDSTYLNALQNGVNRWIREIQKVTKLDRDPSSGTAMQEINFWLNLDRALMRIQDMRESPEITLTLDILKHGKRFHATVSFDTDTGLKQALAKVADYNPLMKDFPLNDLLSATELERIRSALTAIFSHMRKIRTCQQYPIQRALRLIEAISRDLMAQMLKVLGTRRLMHISYEEFEKVMISAFEVFGAWDDEYEKLQGLMRDIVKKKRDENLKMVWRITPAHKKLQTRLDGMRKFRRQHEQLRNVILRVLRPQVQQQQVATPDEEDNRDNKGVNAVILETADANAIEEVNLAYENVKEVDGLDVGKEGTDAWEAALKRYDERIDRVETRITARLRDQLGTAKNANEMFRIFSRFNALFVRPHIRGAIREYQTQLIQRVKDDIESLHEKFKIQYVASKSARMSRGLDLPPVSGSIIWARQIERQLSAYMRRVEDVLGKGWENHMEGQKLKADGDSFRSKLDTKALFEDWSRKVTQRNLGVTGHIFAIDQTRALRRVPGGDPLKLLRLKVNFQKEIIMLAKEVRNLKWLGFRVPLAIVNKAHQANQLYPFAISLMESVRTYEGVLQKIEERPNIITLVAMLRRDLHNTIIEGVQLVWESYKLDPYVQKFAEQVFGFQEKIDDLISIDDRVANEVRSLETCSYNHQVFSEIIGRIQKSVDDLNLHSYSNLPFWVRRLDEKVEEKLAARLEAGLQAWCQVLLGKKDSRKEDFDEAKNADGSGDATAKTQQKLGGDPKIAKLVYEMRVMNQVIYMHPELNSMRRELINELQQWQDIIQRLPRILSSRYQVGLDIGLTDVDLYYRKCLTRIPTGSLTLQRCYEAIESLFTDVTSYVKEWLQYQSLWDMQAELMYNKLGNDIQLWQALLVEIRRRRATFDTSETKRTFGPIVIEYAKVQSKVNLKYDTWHKEVLTKFGQLIGQEMGKFHGQITRSRTELEQSSVDTSNTSDAVAVITNVQALKRNVKGWEKQVEMYREGQRLLEKHRFQFPSSWLYIDNIEGEWMAFTDIMKRKEGAIQTQVASLQMKIVTEDRAVEQRTSDLLSDWERGKPVAGHLRPEEALRSITIFEGKFQRLQDDRTNLVKAKEALELSDAGMVSPSEERVQVAVEEMKDLKEVWSELSKVWDQVEQMKDQQWLSVQPRKLRQGLEVFAEQLKKFPARLRQYSAYEHISNSVKAFIKVNWMVVELKGSAVKERHWKQLMRQLRVSWVLSDLTLGQVWDVDLLRNENIIRDILSVAQGEMALEQYLTQVREEWQAYELDLINYQNKCRIIRGWDDLFNKVKDHINSVSAMKLSPYYKVFEEEATSWEEKLNRISALFDVWIDVQRRWVYLEGIFTGSADIPHLLPVESQRFASISSEFLQLMKKVARSPLVLDVMNIPGVQRSLERLADLLGKIQKALGEYLERERASFPRFYFVGDEDLLEIIGNSKSIPKLQKHFKKMFAGIASLALTDENMIITGILSKEAEQVEYKSPVSLAKHPKINEWLTRLEQEMKQTLAKLLAQSVTDVASFKDKEVDRQQYMEWMDKYQAQLVILSAQISWSENVERALQTTADMKKPDNSALQGVLVQVEQTLNVLADSVLHEQPAVRRRKLEHLITELVHQRDTTRLLIKECAKSPQDFSWLMQMRFYYDPKQSDVLQQLSIHMANARFQYGFEYLGVQDKLVQTPLTDRCYLTMTQALEARLGGSPFGPAGTGKTETVKALGHQMGRFVLVFNCDETFDFQAMGRIFVGLCQVGAWGCFDEFNRLEERMLSAVSQQIQQIQEALKLHSDPARDTSKSVCVELLGKQVKVSPEMAIFITMNPGYAGRSNLPDNLKKLFRSLAMTKPDRQLIAQVLLYSQGFRTAEKLASKVVPFFKLCDEQLSRQSHYDFGLRALKYVLVSAGNVKRVRIQTIKQEKQDRGETVDEAQIAENLPEQEILIQSIMETMLPKLVAEDIPLLNSLLQDVFPNIVYRHDKMQALREEIKKVCEEDYLVYGENEETGTAWVEKVIQLYQVSQINHGLMMVGPSGSGKSSAWRVLLKALQRLEGTEGISYVIDPKAISKEQLYGNLDPNTREWTDGLFTSILRRVIDNVRGELGKRHWVIFDGDVDPEWVENLNSVLDDNKLLTLPNGERLALPTCFRVMFEVQNLKYATMATVSRCGMIWFSEDVLSTDMIFNNFLQRLRHIPLEEGEEEFVVGGKGKTSSAEEKTLSPSMRVQNDAASILQSFFSSDGLIVRVLEYAEKQDHVMDFTRLRALNSLFSMVDQGVRNIQQYNQTHYDFPMEFTVMEQYLQKYLLYCILWSLSGDGKLKLREEMGQFIRRSTSVTLPAQQNMGIIDFEVTMQGQWVPWVNKVPQIEVETHKVAAPDVVVPTLDTVRHEALLYTWLAEHKPIVLCGPPGSGKTMTLFSALRALPDMEVVGLNFSSATTPELLLKTFDHYCEYRRTPHGVVLAPAQLNKWLVLFCDEINLPDMDRYGTQRVISFLRQMVEHGGFYRSSDQAWVKLERVQFVGACNPPTDPGRKPMSHRFLRHVPVIYVDHPGAASLGQIYGTFNRAMLRLIPSLRAYADPLTNAMVDFYTMSQERFTQDMQPHYIYSPREMSRWVRGICEALRPLESLAVEGLVRIWAHEALRLFQDRLVHDEERHWTETNIDMVAVKHFPNINRVAALKRPILYSNWLSKDYVPVDQEKLREYTKARLKVFYEEELDVPLVLFNEVLDNVLRIDRIFRQPQGHLLLIGVSGSGKTTLSRFVAWMNGLSVFQVKVHRKYTGADFDEDLRNVLRRSGCKGERIAFIMDESNVLDSSFLERMNTLLANGEVPGLFEGDEFTTLMTQCKEGAQREGLMLDSQEELYRWFTAEVMQNLHVVFTMNPSEEGLKDRAATSPALFNRCVLNWFGDWSIEALYQVGKEFTSKLDLEDPHYTVPDYIPAVYEELPKNPLHRDMIVNACVFVHQTLHQANRRLAKRGDRVVTISPRAFLDFINHYAKLMHEKREDLEEQQVHLNVGLRKIKETVEQVEELRRDLSRKNSELQQKNNLANEKLKKMVKEQQEAENKKKTSQQIRKQLEELNQHIQEETEKVREELSGVEPAVQDAKQAVRSIKKQHLVEIRSMGNPPAGVKLCLESICLLLGEQTTDWKSIRQSIIKDNFIPTIINFSTDDISDTTRKHMREKYLNNPAYKYETINRASLACGPLVKWAIAQLSYADMLKKVDPLRSELKTLESRADRNQREAEEVEQLIAHLEKSIAKYKEEYALLISEAQAIKQEMTTVEAKVTRSTSLLHSLSFERERWEQSSDSFKSQMSTMPGDSLISAAFVSYAGYFDQSMREQLFHAWTTHLQQANIRYRPDLARVEYLSTVDERMQWQANSLPVDDLCTENAIMLKRFNRYPLIIDPSGQATEYILKQYADKKISQTSFLDDAFRKNLESSLRFGNPLLVQDVESYDPILNPVLNRELRRTGGRVLITIGDQDIDLSPAFTIFLTTRDPTAEFSPDLCSRVTFINFTVTRGSLQSQCLNEVLRSERPDVDAKRSDLLKLQGEYQLRLRQLEKSLLQTLNDVKGRILDDDRIITALETLKKEAAEVSRKVEETDVVMAEVETVSQQYVPLASACSSIYFTLESLQHVHFLYQYSLKFFLSVYHTVLYENDRLQQVKEYGQRLSIIIKDLFQVSYNRVARSLLHDDRVMFAILLARIYLRGFDTDNAMQNEYDHFLRGQQLVLTKSGSTFANISGLTPEYRDNLQRLAHLETFKNISSKFQASPEDLDIWMKCSTPEGEVPDNWAADQIVDGKPQPPSKIVSALRAMLLTQALRGDRVSAASDTYVNSVFGDHFTAVCEQEINMVTIVEEEVKANEPLLLCSVPGYDASNRVDDLAMQLNRQITSIAIGSAEGFSQAEKAINSASRSGRWVLLKNVHLAPGWLVQLEKKLHSLQPHAQFRLFLTMEITPKIPVNLLRAGRVIVFESPPGVKANLLSTFNRVASAQRVQKAPAERARMYFLLAWFHAVVQERLRYAPLGWSKKYEFNDSDLRCACDTIDTWIDDAAKGRANLPPDKVPWSALRTLFSQAVYGGRIDNEFDQRLLNTFLERLFTPASFEHDFALVKPTEGSGLSGRGIVMMEQATRQQQFVEWTERLPEKQTPSWLGLPNNAEKLLLTARGTDIVRKLLRTQLLDEEDDLTYEKKAMEEELKEILVTFTESSDGKSRRRRTSSTLSEGDGRPQWMRSLLKTARNWKSVIPTQLRGLLRTAENIKDPLFRFFEREVNLGVKLLKDVQSDLAEVISVCDARKKQTNYHRTLIAQLTKGILPESWNKYKIPAGWTVMQWITDFSERIQQLQRVSAASGTQGLKNLKVWLGGLFVPEAYITATRQFVAQANSISLEELSLVVKVLDKGTTDVQIDGNSFATTGLILQGANCVKNKLSLSNELSTKLPLTLLSWVKTDSVKKSGNMVTLPVYRNGMRSDLLFTLKFEIEGDELSFHERGVALLCAD